MPRTRSLRSGALVPFASLLLAGAASAQTVATATVREGCSAPAPDGSLEAAPTTPLTFLPNQDDLIVMECESIRPRGGWVAETDLAGFGGKSYLRWPGPDHFSTPGVSTLPFRFEIVNAGDYLLRMHVRHDHPDSSLENDVWVRMDGGPWVKHYNNFGAPSVGVWNWDSVLESTGQKPRYTLTAGVHLFEVSARSFNFKIDRVHLMPQTTFGTSTSFPQSEPVRHRPVIGQDFSVRIGDPCDQAGLTPGVAQALWMGAMTAAPSHPCGTLYKGQEILIALSPPPMRAGAPVLWNGPETGATVTVPVPNDPGVIGLPFYTQAVLLESGNLVLTDALDLVLGDL